MGAATPAAEAFARNNGKLKAKCIPRVESAPSVPTSRQCRNPTESGRFREPEWEEYSQPREEAFTLNQRREQRNAVQVELIAATAVSPFGKLAWVGRRWQVKSSMFCGDHRRTLQTLSQSRRTRCCPPSHRVIGSVGIASIPAASSIRRNTAEKSFSSAPDNSSEFT